MSEIIKGAKIASTDIVNALERYKIDLELALRRKNATESQIQYILVGVDGSIKIAKGYAKMVEDYDDQS